MQTKTIPQLIRERILVLDGAMGTMYWEPLNRCFRLQ